MARASGMLTGISAMGQAVYFARNTRIAVIPATGGTPRSLTDTFDENAGLLAWNDAGIWFAAIGFAKARPRIAAQGRRGYVAWRSVQPAGAAVTMRGAPVFGASCLGCGNQPSTASITANPMT